MRTRLCLQAALTLASLALPVSLQAQYSGFQQPTPEELAMKDEPKAPGAAAIYLYREETVDDNLHYHSFMARIKVLTEKGKELATVGIPYPRGQFQITDIKARTIHADGTVIPLNVKPTDLLMALNTRGGGGQINKMVFTLPSAEVGSILEYKWQLRYDDQTLSSPDWDIAQPYFVRKAHYSFLPFKYMNQVVDSKGNASSRLLYTAMLPPTTKVVEEASGRYVLDATDVAAIPEEEYMPPLGTLIEQVHFYYSSYTSKDDFWKHEGEHWAKEMDRFADESKGLKEAVGQLVAPADNESTKAHKLYDAVMALDNTDYTRRKSKVELKSEGLKQIKNAEDVWKQKSGSSDEIALLYLAMVRSAGLKAYAMTLCDRDRAVFNSFFMSLRQFDDVLVIVSIDGKEMVLDPGERYVPFGQLGWRHTMTAGMRQSPKGIVFAQTLGNPYKEAITLRIADLTVGKDGSVTGSGRFIMTGPEALRWRHAAIENDEDEVKKQFNEYLHRILPDGLNAEFDHFLGLEDYHSQLMAVLKFSGTIGSSTGKHLFLPDDFFESRAKHPFVADEKRQTAVDMSYASDVEDQVTYHTPEGYTVEGAPPSASIPWAGHAAFALKSTVDKNQIETVRNLARAFTLLPPADYGALRDFYQKVSTADQQQLVLTIAKASGGN